MIGGITARDKTLISHATSKKQFYDPFMETTPFLPAKSKLEAVARLYAAAQTPAEPLGPGSKEKKSVLTKTAERLSLDVDESVPKDVLADPRSTRSDVGPFLLLNRTDHHLARAQRRPGCDRG